MTQSNAQAYLKQQRRKQQQDRDSFTALVETPGDLVAGVVLPANAKLFASCAAEHLTIEPLVTVKGATVYGSEGAAGLLHVIGYAEKNVTVQKAAGVASVVTLYIEGDHGVPLKIAEG